MPITRRHFIATAATAALVLPHGAAWAQDAAPFTFDSVKDKAADLAKQPAQLDGDPLPQALRDLDYSHFRMINFRGDQALWRDGGLFQVQLFHRGFQFDRKVTINTIEDGKVTPIVYAPDQFEFRDSGLKPEFDGSLGYSGFRLHFPLNRGDYFDEFAVFQGASYFRLIGRGQTYGLSARGLAIDTAGPQGEEFPFFKEFWLERPAPNAASITIYALLDSKSTTGAYKITLTPEAETEARVEAELYPRMDIKKLGIAPLTSMFLHGKPGNRPFADVRPEVHDSDGLMLHNGGGEWLWRPLVDPRALLVTSFADRGPRGFGLMQRERDFFQYQDLESNYQLRPSAWIEPEGDWADGAIELVEIPSDEEINDNIASYWVPQTPVKGGESVKFAYKMTMLLHDQHLPPAGRATGTRTGPLKAVDVGRDERKGPHRFVVDFGAGHIPSLGERMPIEAVFTTSSGKIDDMVSQKLGANEWRAVFTFTPDGGNDADLRGFLSLHGAPLTETWTYHWAA
jgi:glucans biosynthesis protein